MKYKNKRSIRAPFIDYTEKGLYFITIKTYKNQHLFGCINNDTMYLSPAGKMINKAISFIANEVDELKCEHYIIMPDHVHFIFELTRKMQPSSSSYNSIPPPQGIQVCVQRFKSFTTNKYIQGVKTRLFPPFQNKVWQRNYYERLIRSQKQFENIVNYMEQNPKKWRK